jgi:ubiquinone/menaquinone biosynthesis C-methylase UbiE
MFVEQRKYYTILAKRQNHSPIYLCEAEVVEGLEAVAAGELRAFEGGRVHIETTPQAQSGYIRFHFAGELWRLQALRTIQAVYLVAHFDVSRPRALLGDQNFRIVISQIMEIITSNIPNLFKSLELSAAGENSPTMNRIKTEIHKATQLIEAESKGDLLLRIIPARGKQGWETLIRTTPRPLATRSWRQCNFEGALNATVASAMIELTNPRPDDTYINLGHGSGTLTIERALRTKARTIIGIDQDTHATKCAIENTRGSISKQIDYVAGDITKTPFPDQYANITCTDLPFGQRIGSHQSNLNLYPKVLTEAARITRRAGQFIAITHEIKLMEQLLQHNPDWHTEQVIRITLRGLHPRIYQLRRQ